MRSTALFMGLLVLGASSSANAMDLPLYAVDQQCQEKWSGDAKMTNFCIDTQQGAYDTLKASWTSISDEIAGHCDEKWGPSDDYTMLKFCIDKQTTAYNELDALRSSIPEGVADHCNAKWGANNDYSMIKFCVDQQLSAAGDRSTFNPN